jgi:hypothetical protein
MCLETAQLTVAHGEDVLDDRRYHTTQSHEMDEGGNTDLPPYFVCRKQPRVRDTMDGHSDMSQSDGGKSPDSQDYESGQDEDDLQNLNGNELARTFDNEVRLFRY